MKTEQNMIDYIMSFVPSNQFVVRQAIENILPLIKSLVIADQDTIPFAVYLTGHDEETVKQMYEDWKGGGE